MLKIGASTKNIATLRWLFSALALIPGGCVADIFGERAVSYNQEAATNKDKTILTNIIRASRGRPLQFTDLTTVSGTASQSLSIAGVFPFAVRRPPHGRDFRHSQPLCKFIRWAYVQCGESQHQRVLLRHT
jgi:hypothetical protein